MTRDVRAALLAPVATLMTLLSLGPLLADRDWLQPVVLVVAAVGLAGAAVAAADLPRWVTVPVTSLAALVISTALLVPSQAVLGGFVPTPSSLEALRILLRSGVVTAQAVTPPAATDAGITTLLTLAAGVVAVVTLAVAGPMRRPGAAGLPLLLVVCVATALAPGGIGVLGYLSAGLGYLGLTLVDGDRRVRGWGAVLARRTRSGEPASSGVTEHLASVAAGTAAAALLVGAALPLLVPGSGGERLQSMVTDRFGAGDDPALRSLDPFLDIREDLSSQDDTVLLSYATTDLDPDPLRVVTADVFDGSVWAPSPDALDGGATVADGLPAPPGASPEVLSAAEAVSTTISIGPLVQSYLPLPYPASSVEVEGDWVVDPRTLNVGAADESTQGLQYAVSSFDIAPEAETLAQAPGAGALDPRWTELPAGMSETVLGQAEEVVARAGAQSRYDQALALQQWFRNSGGFTYSLDAPDVTDRDAVEAFLEDRRGYCVQFASTMALMARALDIPARVAVGFLPGEEVSPGRWSIRADDAHAWPELYFEGVGWVRFEPTPSSRTGLPPSWAIPGSDAPVVAPTPGPSQAAPLPPEDLEPRTAGRPGEERSVWDRVLDRARQVLGVVAGLVVAAAALSLPRAWRWWRSRRRRARARGDDAAVALARWTELLERLGDRGALPDGRTVREQVEDLLRRERLDEPARAALARLAEGCERALYAVEPVSAPDGDADVRTVLAGVDARLGRAQRLGATWFPAPSPVTDAPLRRRARERVG